jgi:hypothetical protein
VFGCSTKQDREHFEKAVQVSNTLRQPHVSNIEKPQCKFPTLLESSAGFQHFKKAVKVSNTFRKQQCGGSGMFIPDPGSWFLPIPDPGSRIPDPKTATKERGEKKVGVITYYVAKNFTKFKIILVLKC